MYFCQHFTPGLAIHTYLVAGERTKEVPRDQSVVIVCGSGYRGEHRLFFESFRIRGRGQRAGRDVHLEKTLACPWKASRFMSRRFFTETKGCVR